MSTTDSITQAVKSHLSDEGQTQLELARLLGLAPSSLSQRLRGVRRWNVQDIDALVRAGVLQPVKAVQP